MKTLLLEYSSITHDWSNLILNFQKYYISIEHIKMQYHWCPCGTVYFKLIGMPSQDIS